MKVISSFLCAIALLTSVAAWSDELPSVNINTAGAEALAQLDGIGEKKAEAILEWRDANGEFVSVDQLAEVNGIGSATIDANRERITLE